MHSREGAIWVQPINDIWVRKTFIPTILIGSETGDNDTLFAAVKIDDAQLIEDRPCRIIGVDVADYGDLGLDLDLFFFDAAPTTVPAIGAVFGLAGLDIAALRGVVSIVAADFHDAVNAKVAFKAPVVPVRLLATTATKSIWVVGVARAAQTHAVILYASDFSADADSWVSNDITLAGNIDTIGGEDDNLRGTLSGGAAAHDLSSGATLIIGTEYDISFDLFIPSANAKVDGVVLNVDGATYGTADAWETVAVAGWTADKAALTLTAADGGVTAALDADGDLIYVRNVSIVRTKSLEVGVMIARD